MRLFSYSWNTDTDFTGLEYKLKAKKNMQNRKIYKMAKFQLFQSNYNIELIVEKGNYHLSITKEFNKLPIHGKSLEIQNYDSLKDAVRYFIRNNVAELLVRQKYVIKNELFKEFIFHSDQWIFSHDDCHCFLSEEAVYFLVNSYSESAGNNYSHWVDFHVFKKEETLNDDLSIAFVIKDYHLRSLGFDSKSRETKEESLLRKFYRDFNNKKKAGQVTSQIVFNSVVVDWLFEVEEMKKELKNK